jgi:hypothetical protein
MSIPPMMVAALLVRRPIVEIAVAATSQGLRITFLTEKFQ